MTEIVQSLDAFASSQALQVKVVTKAFMKYYRFITQSYPFLQEMLEEAPEQTLTDNPDMLVGNMGPAMMGDPNAMADPNANPEDQAAMQQEAPAEYAEAYQLFGTTDLHEGMKRFKKCIHKKLTEKMNNLDSVNEAVTSKPYRYSGNSF